jgi:hypothetical protein
MYKVLVIVIIPGIPQYISKSGAWLKRASAKSIRLFSRCVAIRPDVSTGSYPPPFRERE